MRCPQGPSDGSYGSSESVQNVVWRSSLLVSTRTASAWYRRGKTKTSDASETSLSAAVGIGESGKHRHDFQACRTSLSASLFGHTDRTLSQAYDVAVVRILPLHGRSLPCFVSCRASTRIQTQPSYRFCSAKVGVNWAIHLRLSSL